MAAGMRRLQSYGAGSTAATEPEDAVTIDGDLVEVIGESDATVIEIIEPILGAGQLAGLTDVETIDTSAPTILVRDPATGIFHATPLDQIETRQRGMVIWVIEHDPPGMLPDEWRVGDWVAVISGDAPGQMYLITEE